MGRWVWLALLVVVLDQATKLWVVAHLSEQESLPVAPFFNLVLVYNEGAAFSFLSSAGGWQRWLFVVLALLISWVLVRWLLRLEQGDRLSALAYTLVLGGAWGNLIDRLYQGRVTDFIDMYYQQWHWPAFNLADSAIFLGVALLLVGLWHGEQKGS